MKSKYWLLIFLFITFLSRGFSQNVTKVEKIWDGAKHNAFPDLIYTKGYYYCTFREGNSHVDNSNDGQVRVIRSKDLKTWNTVAVFQCDTADVREARLSVMPDGRILANLALGIWKDGRYDWLKPFVAISDNFGAKFSKIEAITMNDPQIEHARDWVWRVTWNKGIGYGILYQTFPTEKSRPWEITVVKTLDGKSYDFVSKIPIDGNPNESTIRFDNKDQMYVLIRRENKDKFGAISKSEYPYNNWSHHMLTWQLGGPNFLFLDKTKLIVGSRYNQEKGAKTGLFLTDLNGSVNRIIDLPSAGDNSYPGMVIKNGNLIVAYYSSHEGKSSIYMAQVPLRDFK